jgi:Leucine-rich repeat (LRR) protein
MLNIRAANWLKPALAVVMALTVLCGTGQPTSAQAQSPDDAYQKAQSLIEEANNANALELNLHGLGLVELPPEIGQLSKLKYLDVSANTLASGATSQADTVGELG